MYRARPHQAGRICAIGWDSNYTQVVRDHCATSPQAARYRVYDVIRILPETLPQLRQWGVERTNEQIASYWQNGNCITNRFSKDYLRGDNQPATPMQRRSEQGAPIANSGFIDVLSHFLRVLAPQAQ